MKYFAFLLCLAFAVPVLAETDYIAMPEIKKLDRRVTLVEAPVTSARIADGTIVNADISASAAIARSKLNTGGINATNTIVGVGGITNTIIVLQGIITSWTIAP